MKQLTPHIFIALTIAGLIYFGFWMGRQGIPAMDGITCQWVLPQPMMGELK